MTSPISPVVYRFSNPFFKVEITFLKGVSLKWALLALAPVVAGVALVVMRSKSKLAPPPPLPPPPPPISKAPSISKSTSPPVKQPPRDKTAAEIEAEKRAAAQAAVADQMAEALKKRRQAF